MPGIGKTTAGQALVNGFLPEALRDTTRVLDKKSFTNLMNDVYDTVDAKQLSRITSGLGDVARHTSFRTGGYGANLPDLKRLDTAKEYQAAIRNLQTQIDDDDSYGDDDDKRNAAYIDGMRAISEQYHKKIFDEALAKENPIALQARSGLKGNPSNYVSLVAGTGLYQDEMSRTIPVLVDRGIASGLSGPQFWAAMQGARKGVIDVKAATMQAGYLSKQLVQAAHRLRVSALDGDQRGKFRGLPVDTTDRDSIGAFLAKDVAGYDAGTQITARVLDDIHKKSPGRILVRSPLVGGPRDGGVYSRDVGIRETGRLPQAGDNVGIAATHAISEFITQSMISSKHTGGAASAQAKGLTGFDRFSQQLQVPKNARLRATHAERDGTVLSVRNAPQGGQYVQVNDETHYVPSGLKATVAVGQKVEAGDTLSEGLPNPAEFVRHKGIGEGRRRFVRELMETTKALGLASDRRNVELLARALIGNVQMTDLSEDYLPGDIVPYTEIEATYEPRPDAKTAPPKAGGYLEEPVLHYTIGTPVTPSVVKTLQEFGVDEIVTHEDPPPFEAIMLPAATGTGQDPDWMVRMLPGQQRKTIADAVHRGRSTELEGSSSYVPALASGRELRFGTPFQDPDAQRKNDA